MPLTSEQQKRLEAMRELIDAEKHLVEAYPDIAKRIRRIRKKIETDFWINQIKLQKVKGD